MSQQSLMVANFKMHKSVQETHAYGRELARQAERSWPQEQVICPTYPAIFSLQQSLRFTEVKVGAQNLDLGQEGAHTGAISGPLLLAAGAFYVILGHSERRLLDGETDEVVQQKTKAALDAGLIPIVCVGESSEERVRKETDEVISRQVSAVMEALTKGPDCAVVFAYEPLWAIGTGMVPEPSEASRVAQLIHQLLSASAGHSKVSARVLYGGSVNAENVVAFAEEPLVDGVLVGGASLHLDGWIALNRLWGEVRA